MAHTGRATDRLRRNTGTRAAKFTRTKSHPLRKSRCFTSSAARSGAGIDRRYDLPAELPAKHVASRPVTPPPFPRNGAKWPRQAARQYGPAPLIQVLARHRTRGLPPCVRTDTRQLFDRQICIMWRIRTELLRIRRAAVRLGMAAARFPGVLPSARIPPRRRRIRRWRGFCERSTQNRWLTTEPYRRPRRTHRSGRRRAVSQAGSRSPRPAREYGSP